MPFFFFLFKFGTLTPGTPTENIFVFSPQNTLIFFSFLFFYFFPFQISKKDFSIEFFKENFKKIGISLFVVLIFSFFFTYDYKNGGGVYFKISNILLGNNSLFYLSSVFGLYYLFDIYKKNFLDNILIFLPTFFILIFLSIPYQEYIAIFFVYIYFLILNKNVSEPIFLNFKPKFTFIYLYFLCFLIGSILYNTLNIKSYL